MWSEMNISLRRKEASKGSNMVTGESISCSDRQFLDDSRRSLPRGRTPSLHFHPLAFFRFLRLTFNVKNDQKRSSNFHFFFFFFSSVKSFAGWISWQTLITAIRCCSSV